MNGNWIHSPIARSVQISAKSFGATEARHTPPHVAPRASCSVAATTRSVAAAARPAPPSARLYALPPSPDGAISLFFKDRCFSRVSPCRSATSCAPLVATYDLVPSGSRAFSTTSIPDSFFRLTTACSTTQSPTSPPALCVSPSTSRRCDADLRGPSSARERTSRRR